jgi:hypothetical protein
MAPTRSPFEVLESMNFVSQCFLEQFKDLGPPAMCMVIEDPEYRPSFYLPSLINSEEKALATGTLEDDMAVWSIPFYGQCKYWLKLFIGFNYGLFALLLQHWTLIGLPDLSFSEHSVTWYQYLAEYGGVQPVEEIFLAIKASGSGKHLKTKYSFPAKDALQRSAPKSLLGRSQARQSTCF